ncbi:MAG: 16S rRNA (guanine(527)-N(7))-methyltransferase RsmG [Candidatus Lutacidiplasmatales archaeon]
MDDDTLNRNIGRLAEYVRSLAEANDRMNLVSRRSASLGNLLERHLGDSLRGARLLHPPGPRRLVLADIGSGGGFPAVPLLVVRSDIDGWLFESTTKKARFLTEVATRLALTSTIVNARFPSSTSMKEVPPIDILTTRAVAGAGRLVRAARPWLSKDAVAILWTTRTLFRVAVQESGMHRWAFHETPGTEQAGIAVLECST